MKSIIYILITVFIFSILTSAFPKAELKTKQTFTLQCVNDDIPLELLKKSSDILVSRLSDYGIQDSDVFIDNVSLKDLEESIGIPVHVIESTPEGILKGFMDENNRNN